METTTSYEYHSSNNRDLHYGGTLIESSTHHQVPMQQPNQTNQRGQAGDNQIIGSSMNTQGVGSFYASLQYQQPPDPKSLPSSAYTSGSSETSISNYDQDQHSYQYQQQNPLNQTQIQAQAQTPIQMQMQNPYYD